MSPSLVNGVEGSIFHTNELKTMTEKETQPNMKFLTEMFTFYKLSLETDHGHSRPKTFATVPVLFMMFMVQR